MNIMVVLIKAEMWQDLWKFGIFGHFNSDDGIIVEDIFAIFSVFSAIAFFRQKYIRQISVKVLLIIPIFNDWALIMNEKLL